MKQTPTVEEPLGEVPTKTKTLGKTDSPKNRVAIQLCKVTRTPVAVTTVTNTTVMTEKVELPSQQVIYLRLVYRFSGL